MTLSRMAQEQVYFYKRGDWGAGQYVHVYAVFTNEERQGAVGGMELCFCSAPMHGDDARVEDDLWMRYDGPEVNDLVVVGGVQGALLERMLDSGMPLAVAAVLSGILAKDAGHEQDLSARIGVPPWQVGQEMQS